MGTWSAPQTKALAEELKLLLAGALHGSEAADKLYHLVGNDDLFDEFYDHEDNPDVRFLVIDQISEWVDSAKENPGNWSHPWEPEAIEILEGIIKEYGTDQSRNQKG